MSGQIAITKDIVEGNKIGWNVFDFFKHELNVSLKSDSHSAGWYAYKLIDNVYYFKWADNNNAPKEKYLIALREDGYELGVTSKAIQDYFKSDF